MPDHGLAEDIGGLPAQLQDLRVMPGRQGRELVLADPGRDVMVRMPGDELADQHSQPAGRVRVGLRLGQGLQ
jgi:hypothetical protein